MRKEALRPARPSVGESRLLEVSLLPQLDQDTGRLAQSRGRAGRQDLPPQGALRQDACWSHLLFEGQWKGKVSCTLSQALHTPVLQSWYTGCSFKRVTPVLQPLRET